MRFPSPSLSRSLRWGLAVLGLVLLAWGLFRALKLKPSSAPLMADLAGEGDAALSDALVPPEGLAFRTRSGPTSIRMEISWQGPAPAKTLNEPMIFCAPPARPVNLSVLEARSGPRPPLYPADPAAQSPEPLLRRLGETIEWREVGFLWRWRLIEVNIRPEFWAVMAGESLSPEAQSSVALELTWNEPYETPPEMAERAAIVSAWGWGRVGAALVANPDGLERYRAMETPFREGVRPELRTPWSDPDERARPWARLRLADRGLYRLNVEDLLSVGFPAGQAKPEAVRLFARGRPVPLIRRRHGPQQVIYFWNDGAPTPYSAERVYWATLGPDLPDPTLPILGPDEAETPRRVDRIVRTARLDRDRELLTEIGNFLAVEKMIWLDAPIRRGHALERRLPLPGYAPTAEPIQAAFEFYLETPDRSIPPRAAQVKLTLNGEPLERLLVAPEARFNRQVRRVVSLPPARLLEEANALTFAAEGAVPAGDDALETAPRHDDAATTPWLNAVEIEYPSQPAPFEGRLRLREPSDAPTGWAWTPLAGLEPTAELIAVALDPELEPIADLPVSELEGERGLGWPTGRGRTTEVVRTDVIPLTPRFERVAPDDLASSEQGADVLIITHGEFLDLVQPLAELHRRRGLRVRQVDVQSIYDHFSQGELSPEAIRDFLAHTLAAWKYGAPTYVTLVGDATSDYLGLARKGVRNWVPTYTYDAGPERWASDHWLAVVAGSDDLADFMIGRLSVANREDARTLIEKLVAYAERPAPGPWRARVGFVADDGEFPPVTEELRREHTPPAFASKRIYLDETASLEDNWYAEGGLPEPLKVSPATTARLIEAFRDGMSYLVYFGHGSPNIWMEERVWFGGDSESSDNRHLAGSRRPTFVVTMTCNTGAIDYPVPPWNINLSEDMMRVPDGGAIGLFVPTGPGVTLDHRRMAIWLHRSLFQDRLRGLGELTALTKARHALAGHSRELTYMYLLLGDPALELHLTSETRTFTLPRPAYAPTDRIETDLTDLDLQAGRFTVAIESAEGALVWEADAQPFSGRTIPVSAPIPESAPEGSALLRLYAWSEAPGGDVAAAAPFRIERPRVIIEAARAYPYPSPRIEVELHNPTSVELPQGRLDVLQLWDEATSATVARLPFVLPAEARSMFTIELDPPRPNPARAKDLVASEQPIVYELSASVTPAHSMNGARHAVRLSLAPTRNWKGIVPLLCAIEPLGDAGGVGIAAAALLGDASAGDFELGIEDSAGRWVTGLSLTPENGLAKVTLPLLPPEVSILASGTLRLRTANYRDAETALPLASVPLASLGRREPRLRLVDGSIRASPEGPSEGQTIFVEAEVENVGNAASPGFSLELLDADPALGGRRAVSHVAGGSRVHLDRLEPGQRRRARLRWDPIGNAGPNRLYVRLDPGRPAGASSADDLLKSVDFSVRTKYRLARGETRMEETRDADGALSYVFLGEVANQGQSEARNVIVTFYRSEIRIPENELGEVFLPVVPPEDTVTARFTWKPDARDPAAGPEPPLKPVHVIRLKGSQQRIARLAPAFAEGAAPRSADGADF